MAKKERRMKKVFYIVMMIVMTHNTYASEDLFNQGRYEFVSSDKNTSSEECPMSPYKKGSIVFFRNDTAYMFYPKLDLELDTPIVCQELMGLGIEGTFAFDKNANKIYFSKSDGSGNYNLYEATYNKDKWDEIKELKIKGVMPSKMVIKGSSLAGARWNHSVKGTSGFYNPSLGKNGKRIYFSGTFLAGKGNRDLWFIDKAEDDLWSRPKSIGDSINTTAKEDYALVIGDTTLFFASTKAGGFGDMDIYMAHKQRRDSVWGAPVNMGDNINSSASDYNVAFNKVSAYFISDRNGGKGKPDIYRPIWINPARENELVADMTIEEPKDFHWVLFFFDFDKSDMKPEYEAQMDELVRAMKEFPGAKFEVSGHTDSRGSDEYNMTLSKKRAEYIKKVLIQKGLEPSQITAIGKGMREPVIPDAQDEAEHEQNRRVDIKIINE